VAGRACLELDLLAQRDAPLEVRLVEVCSSRVSIPGPVP
jgi:hypothetical protein